MPVVRGGQLQAFLQIGMPLGPARRALRRYLETLLVLIPLGVALAAAGGAAISRAALTRVDEMSRSARRISAQDLSRRVQLRGTGDELDRLAETLNEMLARLEGAFAQMQRFTADASHELRTPLTALRGGVEVALRAERSTEEYRRVLRSSLEEVERLVRLSEDLLLLSRSTAGGSAARATVDLEALCVEVLEVGARLAEGRDVAVRLDTIGPASVIGDAAALRRAALNLVENAVKYTPAGGKVELSLSCGDGHATLTVRDTGAGIDPSDTSGSLSRSCGSTRRGPATRGAPGWAWPSPARSSSRTGHPVSREHPRRRQPVHAQAAARLNRARVPRRRISVVSRFARERRRRRPGGSSSAGQPRPARRESGRPAPRPAWASQSSTLISAPTSKLRLLR